MLGDGKEKSSWFLAGLGLGAFAGVLFAPKSGCETRKAIAAGVDDGLEHITAFGHGIRDGANRIAESGKKQVKVATDAAKRILKRPA